MKKTLLLSLALLALALVFGCSIAGGTKSKEYSSGAKLSFTAEDIDGNTVSFSDFADKKVIMVNFFESWCGPCVSELPALESLFEKYGDDGLVILGVYGSSEEGDVRALTESLGVSYPILPEVAALTGYRTDYVPTTVFFGPDGAPLTSEPTVGAKNYEGWESLIASLLNN